MRALRCFLSCGNSSTFLPSCRAHLNGTVVLAACQSPHAFSSSILRSFVDCHKLGSRFPQRGHAKHKSLTGVKRAQDTIVRSALGRWRPLVPDPFFAPIQHTVEPMEFRTMRLAAAFALVAAVLVSTAAADNTAPSILTQEYSSPSDQIIYSTPMVTSSGQLYQANQYPTSQQYSAQPQTFFGRWMELERRKNAWIRARLFGR